MRFVLSISLLLLATSITQAEVSVATIFSDNMVIQRNNEIAVWGWAKVNEKISVSFKGKKRTTITNKKGEWKVKFKASKAGGPYEMTVQGNTNIIVLKNILVGDVWLCSGQSNMEWTVAQSANAKAEIAKALHNTIRHIKIPKAINSIPEQNVKSCKWQICTSETVGDFSAVAYFFAQSIVKDVDVPIGIINSSWGGTNIETWMSRQSFDNSDEFKSMAASLPIINLDSLEKTQILAIKKRIEMLQQAPISKESITAFQEIVFDDSLCPTMSVPKIWEEQKLGDVDGIIWLRKKFYIAKDVLTKSSVLELSKIDDIDETFVNGVKVGGMAKWNAQRKYNIPAGLLHQGENIVVIKVEDTGGGGGIYGDKNDVKITIDNEIIPLSGEWKYRVESIRMSSNENSFPSLCYNAMIHPLLPIGLSGVLWYQGESNVGRAYQYRTSFPLMIEDWRLKFNRSKRENLLPFYFVQLATFDNPGNSTEGCAWAELREAQALTLKIPNTGMCVTTDIGDPIDIHPTNKQTVGKRLADLALNKQYNVKRVDSGPSYSSMQIVDNNIVISFNNIGEGLMTTDTKGLVFGFEIAGSDGIFHPANARILKDKVVVSCDKVLKPQTVNYGWMGDASMCNLFNRNGFPAIPFRSHDIKSITKQTKYKPTLSFK